MADPTTPAQTTPGTALTPDQLSTILSGMKESADDGLTPYQREVADRKRRAEQQEAEMERRILAMPLPGVPGATVGQHMSPLQRASLPGDLRTGNPTRSPLQGVVREVEAGRAPFVEDIDRIGEMVGGGGGGGGGSRPGARSSRSVALGGGNAAEGVIRTIGPAAPIYEQPSVSGIPVQMATGRQTAERVWSTAKGPETAAQREAAATAMGYGDHKVEQDEAWTGKWLIPGLPMDVLDTPRRFLNMLGFGAAEALPDQTPDDDRYTSELMKAGRILMAPITWGMDAQEAFHDAVTKPVAGVVARAVKAAPGQEPGLLERAILNLGAGVESRRDDLGVLAAAMNPPAIRVDDAERDLLVDRIGDRFLAAATSGEIREAAEMHPSLTRWENTKSVLDAISPDVSAFLMPGDDGRWQNISGMDVLNVSIDPDEARILAGDALARGNKAEGMLFTALSTETGRTLMGIGLDIVADPMWLVGPAKMGQVVAVGDQAWTVAKPALVAARELVGLAGGSSDDAMRVVVRALQGEEAALVTVRQGREATAQKVAGLRAEAARLAAGGEQQVVTQARAAVAQAEQSFAAMTTGAEAYQQAGGAARLAEVRGQIDAARALLGQVQRSPKSWVARRQGQIKTQLARALEAEANLGKIADQTAPWWYAGEKGLVQLHWGDATLELGAYARPWAVRAWDGLAGAAGRAVEPINPRAINRRVRSIMVERGLSQADAVQTLDLGSRLLWTAGTGADKLSRLGTDVVRVLGYALGTRFMRPATMLADQFSRIWSRDAAAMAQLTDRLRGTTNLIDLPNVSRQIWGDYQNALGAFFDALGSRESFLRASTQAIRREAHAAHALRVEAARAWQTAGRPASRRVTVRGREVVVDPAWLAPDYNRLQIHIDAIVAEAAEHLERGSGLLDPTSPFYRAELVPMLERFREMVAALRDMPEGVDLNQQVIRVVRSYKGTREHAAAAKGALDKAMKTVEDIKEEGNVARRAEKAAEKAQKQVDAMDKLDELLTDDGAARALVRAHKDLERVEGAAPPPVRGPKGEAEAPTAKGEAKAGGAAEKPAGEAKDTATAKPEGEGASAPDVDAPEADPLAGVKGDAEAAKAKAKGISDLLDEQRIRATRGKEEELRRAEEVQQLLAEKKAATPAKGKGKLAEAPVDGAPQEETLRAAADRLAAIRGRTDIEPARKQEMIAAIEELVLREVGDTPAHRARLGSAPADSTTRPLADIDADLTAAKAARDEAMAARKAADIEATRLQAELQEAKIAQKKADEAVAAAKKAQAEEKKKAAAEKLRLDQERAAAEERARAAAEARAKEEAYASDPAYAPHTGARQQQNRPMADAGREAVRRAFTERVSMILPRGGMSEAERQEQIAATVDAALEALRASTGHKTVGEAAEALYQRAMGAGEKNKKLREMQGAAKASAAMDNEIVATVKAGLERLRTDAVERRRLLLEFLSAPEEKKGELLEGLVDASIRKARLDALETGATVDELNAAYRGGDALMALEERIGKRKARAAVRHWRTYIDGADGRLGVSQANAAALRVEDAVGHLSGEAPVVRLDVLAHRIQRLLGTGREVKAADLVASMRTLIPSALDAEAAERAILAAERAAEQFAADANRVGNMVRGEGITQGTAAIKGVQEAVKIFKQEILASVKASTDEAARLMALAPERAKRLKDAEKAVKEAEEAYTRAIPTVKAAPGEVIGPAGGRDVGHNLWTDGTRREATAWEDAIWNAWRVSSEGFTPEESMTALLGLLRNEPVIPRVAGEMGQRLGQMPAELTELSSRLKQVFDQYERWYQRVGFGFVTDPAERLKMWGTVAYVPHFRPTPEEVASGDIYRTFKPAGTVRGSGASAIDAQLSLQMNAKERRLIGGVAAEINAAAADHSIKFDLDGMLNRYLQSGKAISAAEYFVLLLRTNVVRRFDPVVDGAGVVARSADELAREASYVPLFQRSVQGRDMDLLLTGTAEDWARAGITADEVRAARTAMQESGKEASPFGAWIRSIPLLQQTGNVEQIILAERVADLAAGRPLFSVSARISELEAAGLEGRALWTELAEEMNTLATTHGLRHVEAGALEAVFADKGWRLYVPAQVAESMARLFEETAPTSMIGKLFKGTLDKFNQWYKSWYTIAQTSFTFRNAASNFMTNCLDIGPMGALSAQTNITATAMYTASNLFFNYGSIARAQAAAETGGTALQAQMRVLRPFLENGIDLGDGVVRTLDEAMALLVEHNVIARGYTPLGDMSAFNESMARSYYSWRQSPRAAAEALVKELPGQAMDYGLTAFSVLAGAPLTVLPRKWGATLAQFVETQARCTNFIAGLRQGRTVEQAGQHVQKFLFNYEDLTGFQKTWMRSLIPFFTWTQKNLLLQAEMIREAPAFYQKQAQIIQGWGEFVEGIDRDAGLRPLPRQVYSDTETAQRAEQLRQRYILPLPKLFTGIEGIGITGLGTPQEAAMDLAAQIGALADLPKVASGDYKGMRLLAQFNFIARMIVEGATGEDVFYGRPWTELNNAAMPLQTFAALETIRKQNIPGISSMAAAMHYGLQVALQPTITVEADYRERAYAPPGRIWLYRNTPWSQTIRKVAAATDAYAVSYMDDPKAAQTVWVAPPWLRTLNSFMGIGTMQDNPYHLVADEKREELREWHDTLEREGITRQSESSRLR